MVVCGGNGWQVFNLTFGADLQIVWLRKEMTVSTIKERSFFVKKVNIT